MYIQYEFTTEKIYYCTTVSCSSQKNCRACEAAVRDLYNDVNKWDYKFKFLYQGTFEQHQCIRLYAYMQDYM